MIVGFAHGGWGQEPGNSLAAGEGKKTDSPLAHAERTTALSTFLF